MAKVDIAVVAMLLLFLLLLLPFHSPEQKIKNDENLTIINRKRKIIFS
jgi:hypothetical protein